VDFDVTSKLMTVYFAFVKCLRKKTGISWAVYTVLIDLKKFVIKVGDDFV